MQIRFQINYTPNGNQFFESEDFKIKHEGSGTMCREAQ